jgi:hypothetical protein
MHGATINSYTVVFWRKILLFLHLLMHMAGRDCFVTPKHAAVYRRTVSSSFRVHYIYHKPDIVSRTVLWPHLLPQLAFKLHNTRRCRCSRSRAFWKLEIIRVKWRPLERTAFVSRHAIVWNNRGSTSSPQTPCIANTNTSHKITCYTTSCVLDLTSTKATYLGIQVAAQSKA